MRLFLPHSLWENGLVGAPVQWAPLVTLFALRLH